MINIGWHFYRDYFDVGTVKEIKRIKGIRELSEKDKNKQIERLFEVKNRNIFEKILQKDAFNSFFEVKKSDKLMLKTTYPGLLSGSGLMHESGNIGEIKLGFMLDHTTGLPYLPGSSVKGVLRHIFPFRLRKQAASEKDKELKSKLMQKSKQLHTYCNHLFGELRLTPSQLLDFEWRVFEGKIITNLGEVVDADGKVDFDKMKEQSIGIYESDVFYDAFITESLKHQGKFIGNDFITPHKHPKGAKNPEFRKYDDLVNPTPIQFMKVLPEVIWCFQFGLKKELTAHLGLDEEKKKALFKQILLDLGIGAKTNVGYGQLKPIETP